MDTTLLKQALYTALKPFLPERTIWLDQGSPRPAKPYSTLRITDSDAIGMDTFGPIDDDGVMTVEGQRQEMLNIEYYGDGAVTNLRAFRDRLQITNIRYPLARAGIVIYDSSNVTDIAALMGGIEYEGRAGMDVFFRYKSELYDTVGIIETFNSTGSTIAGIATNIIARKP